MFNWFSGNRKKVQTKAERDAELRAELAIKARQFDEENGHLFEAATETTADDISEVTINGKKEKSSSITIMDVSARTSFNF